MKRSTRWLIGGMLGSFSLCFVLVAWSWLAERHVVARLLASGASVAFESDARVLELVGSHSSHCENDPRLPFALFESDASIVAHGNASPSGHVWSVSIFNVEGMNIVLNDLWAFKRLEVVMLDSGVDNESAHRFIDAVAAGAFSLEGLDCYASIDRQETLDRLLQLDLKVLLIGCPAIEDLSLSAITGSTTLESLWINEGDAGCEGMAEPRRYGLEDMKAIASIAPLKKLVLVGLELNEGMVEALTGATQLEQLKLSRCVVSDDSADLLRVSLPNTQISITTPDDVGTAIRE